MYVSIPCNVANGAVYDPAATAKSAAQRAKTDAATNQAQAAYSGLLCRNPGDFTSFGLTVAKDVMDTNAATQCTPGQAPPVMTAAPGGGSARSGLYRVGGPGGIAASCDISDSEYAVSETPLNGPGPTTLPAPSARPAVLTTAPLLKPGIGRWSRRISRIARGGAGGRGMGACCSEFPAWGDAFPTGGPSSSDTSALSSITNWIAANPWLTIGLGAAGVFLMAGSGSRGKRG